MAARPDINRYLNLLKTVSKRSAMMCIFCGNDNTAYVDPWICAFCESTVYNAIASAAAKDKTLMKSIESINGYVENGEYKPAADLYATIVEKNGNPQYLYAAALLDIAHSNDEVARIRYDRHGFMEENAEHRIEASRLMSNAKLLFNRAIFRIKGLAGTAQITPDMAFTAFMSSIKSGNLRAAKTYMEYLTAVHQLNDYANMVMSAELGRFDDLYRYADKLLDKNVFMAGALYYVAWGMFKQKRYRESERILNALSQVVRSKSVAALLKDIDDTKKID